MKIGGVHHRSVSFLESCPSDACTPPCRPQCRGHTREQGVKNCLTPKPPNSADGPWGSALATRTHPCRGRRILQDTPRASLLRGQQAPLTCPSKGPASSRSHLPCQPAVPPSLKAVATDPGSKLNYSPQSRLLLPPPSSIPQMFTGKPGREERSYRLRVTMICVEPQQS